MSVPEELVGSFADCWMSEGEDDACDDKECNSGDPCECLEQPVSDVGLVI